MKKSLLKNSLKTIKKTRRRFISILIMAFLGVGFFAGLVASSPDMLDSLDNYADNNNLYDISILSTLGFTDEDIEKIGEIDGIENVYGVQTKDSLTKIDGKESICKVIEYNEKINTPAIIAGRNIENENECLLDSAIIRTGKGAENYIGKKIVLENTDTSADDNPTFKIKEFEIVGIIETPIYISTERGNTSIGNGTVSFYIFTKDSAIDLDYYTGAYVTVKNAKETVTNSTEYLELVNPVIDKLEEIKQEREEKRYTNLVNEATDKVEKAQKEFDDKKEEVNSKLTDAENKIKEAEEKLAEAQQKLNSAREDIKKIEKCKWYIQDRTDNTGYTNIFDAIKTMSNISKMFPVIFYLVSVLISLTTMTRMIEEERIEIGTLKALGYTNTQIIFKYILYSVLACVIGGILGMTVGLYLLPNIVWKLYSMIYNIPKFYCTYRVEIGLLGIIIAFLCIGGATIIVAKKELKEMPSVLMRPKPPKKGKRILLEKMTFIWKRFNFSQKVTARNIFRYKKRAIMTIIGIAGCTGLMLTGFGIKDSVVDIPNAQFKGIFKYDSAITLTNTNELENIEKYLNDNEDIEEYTKICASAGKLEKNNINCNTNVFISESLDNYENAYNLINYQTGEKIKLNSNGIVITDKAADMLGVTYGDYVTFIDGDDVRYEFKVENITKNHVGHYIYMTKDFYQENVKQYKTNMIYINTKDISIERQNDISRDILKFDGVASVTIIDTLMKTVSDMLNTMNYVVVILIVASALLAFVVLYSLANINIAERQREIATLKVLGFYDREVDNYINKENIIFTILGVIIGLVFGTFLTTGIILSIEIDSLRFMQNITILSYIYSAIITIAFSIIVNFIIHFVLKKINMIESLKSVE